MLRKLVILACTVGATFIVTKNSQAVLINGSCYLEFLENHADSRVLFQADSPSAITDSVFTDSLGFYEIDIVIGLYDIYFSHAEYQTQVIPNQLFSSDSTLDPVTLLQIGLNGELTGLLEGKTYRVYGDIFVPQNNSLVIQAGATLLFSGQYAFYIYGQLSAIGTISDSIVFALYQGVAAWDGLDFQGNLSDFSTLAFCKIEGSISSGVSCDGSSPAISHCLFINNEAEQYGGGIQLFYANSTIENCRFLENSAGENGGAICIRNSSPIIDGCIMDWNSASNGGGGIAEIGAMSSSTISNCVFIGNSANVGTGGGAVLCSNSTARIDHCLLWYNVSFTNGGGICSIMAPIQIDFCTIVANTANLLGGGIYCYSSQGLVLSNSIVEGNLGYAGIYFHGAQGASAIYSNFSNNQNGNFGGTLPPYIGLLVTVNENGDSCDVYRNIFEAPLFVNPGGGDLHLQSNSPCIDAGDPTSLIDPDGTLADLGAFYYDQSTAIANNKVPNAILSYGLLQNHPNPFNLNTVIKYILPISTRIAISVFDLRGCLVTGLSGGWHKPGTYEVTFNGSGLAAGLYFVRLEAEDFTSSCKMLLLK